MTDWKKNFPLPVIRSGQEQAIEFALETFKTKKYVVLEAPTGAGKSMIGVTLARTLAKFSSGDFKTGSYFLTTQKMLQDQYLTDFAPPKGELVSIKSAANFQCSYHSERTCSESRNALNAMGSLAHGTRWFKTCMGQCPYKQAKKDFIEGVEGVTNYSYFLLDSGLEPRQFLVCDEAHTIADAICKWISIDISKKFITTALSLDIPKFKTDADLYQWVVKTYHPELTIYHTMLKETIQNDMDMSGEINAKIAKRFDTVDRHFHKMVEFIQFYYPEGWIVTDSEKSISFKPLDAAKYSNSLFRMGEKCLLMSATILDIDMFCKDLGIDKNDVGFLRLDSTFPIENRKIDYVPMGKMSKASQEASLPNLISGVDIILDGHPNSKGIIHVGNFVVGKAIYEGSKHKSRFLLQDEFNKEMILAEHFSSTKPTVLISPSMTEGVDLKDDLSRFQIVAKLPFPYLGDKYVKAKFDKQDGWYDYVTLRAFVQSIGRSVRHETDWAATYILDECFDYFYKKNKHRLPKYITDSIKL